MFKINLIYFCESEVNFPNLASAIREHLMPLEIKANPTHTSSYIYTVL